MLKSHANSASGALSIPMLVISIRSSSRSDCDICVSATMNDCGSGAPNTVPTVRKALGLSPRAASTARAGVSRCVIISRTNPCASWSLASCAASVAAGDEAASPSTRGMCAARESAAAASPRRVSASFHSKSS